MKMDASNNDVPPTYEVRGFPTLFWVPKNDKTKPVKYEVCLNFLAINMKGWHTFFLLMAYFFLYRVAEMLKISLSTLQSRQQMN